MILNTFNSNKIERVNNLFIDEKHLKTDQSLFQWISSLPEMNQTKPQIRFLRTQ